MAAGIATGFVRKLYRILDLESDAIISWDPTGRSFSIHDAEQLNERVLPRYFRGRLCAFRQQLVDHGFEQLECEDNETREVYRHDHFLQGCPGQLSLIKRVPKPKRKAPTAVALVMPPAAAVRNGMLQVPARAPSSLTVTLSAGSIGGVKRMNSGAATGGSNTPNAVEPNKRLRMEPPLTVTVTNTATTNGGAVHQNSRTTGIANTNPLFSNEPDAGMLSFARLAESGMLPCSTDLPEPISYLTKMTQATATASDPAQQPAGAPTRGNRSLADPPMFSDDLFRSALFYLASSTTGTTDPTEKPNGTAPAGAQDNNEIKTSVDKNGNVSVSSNLLAVLMASSTSCMPPATTSTGNNGSSTWSSNPLFSDQSTGDDDDSEDSIWNLLVASSIDRVKSAMADGQTPQQRLKLILDERERLEEQRKKFTRGAAVATTSVGTASTNATNGANTTNTQLPAVQKKPLNPLFAAKTTTRASNPVAPPTAAPPMPSNPLFAKPASMNPLFAKSSSSTAIASAATSNPLFAKTATTTASAGATTPTTSNPLFAKASSAVAPRANSHEDDLWRLLMSSSIDSFRRVGHHRGARTETEQLPTARNAHQNLICTQLPKPPRRQQRAIPALPPPSTQYTKEMTRSRRPSAPSSMRKPSPPAAATAASAGAAVATHAGNNNNIRGTLVGTVAEGMAFGAGSAVARAAVGAVASGGDGHYSATQPAASLNPLDVCSDEKKAFMDCLSKTCNDIFACQSYQEMLNQCRHERESQ